MLSRSSEQHEGQKTITGDATAARHRSHHVTHIRISKALAIGAVLAMSVITALGLPIAAQAAADPYALSAKDGVLNDSIPKYALTTRDIPNEYKGFEFTTKGYSFAKARFGSGWGTLGAGDTASRGEGVSDPKVASKGATVTLPDVGTWTDPQGAAHKITATLTVVDVNQGVALNYNGSFGIGGWWKMDGSQYGKSRYGLAVRVSFTYSDTGKPVPDTFKGMTGFADLDGGTQDFNGDATKRYEVNEGVEAIGGIDGLYTSTGSPHLRKFGDNGYLGTDDHSGQTSTTSVHDQQHLFGATFTGPSFTIRYSAQLAEYAMIFYPPITQDQLAGAVRATAVNEAGKTLRPVWVVEANLSEGGKWNVTPPTIDGYTYKGLANGSDPASGAMGSPVSNKTVTFVYSKKQPTVVHVSVKFDKNTSSAVSVAVPATQTVDVNGKATEPSTWKAGSTGIRSGYAFGGWYTTTATTGSPYAFATTPVTKDITLYAKWTPVAYKIRYDKNAGDATGSMADQQMQFDKAANLTKNAFSRPGYAFGGWASQADGGGKGYADGQSVINLTTVPDATVTMYAKWTPLPGGIKLDKVAKANDANGNGRLDAGETVSYSFTVTNTGQADLRDVAVKDDLLGETVAVGSLAAGKSATVTAKGTHTVTVSEALAGKVTNTATVTGTPTNGGAPVSGTDTATVNPVAPKAGIKVEKAAALDDANGNGKADYGEGLGWKVTVTNTGEVDLSDVTLDDKLAGITGKVVAATLPVGKSATFDVPAAKVTVDQAKQGSIENTAIVTATPPAGMGKVTDDGTAKVETEEPRTGLTVTKEANLADGNGDGKGNQGETVTYAITVTNTGTVDLTDVVLTDPMFGTDPLFTIDALKAGESKVIMSPEHAISEDEAKTGRVDNTAHAKGTPPEGLDAPEADGSATVETAYVEPKPVTPDEPQPAADTLAQTGDGTASVSVVLATVAGAGGMVAVIARKRRTR